ncbi:MAG: hypothetical protein WHV67_09140, partial [Thermoanaerobaculia bacterium]
MMEKNKFFKEMPYPFLYEEERKLKEKILSSLPEKNFNFFPKLAFAFILLIVLILPFLFNKKETPVERKKVVVLNPLKIKSEEIALKDLNMPIPPPEEVKIEDIPFQITKVDHSIKLFWEDSRAKKFRIKKCYLPPGKEGCVYLEETDKKYYIDNSKEE